MRIVKGSMMKESEGAASQLVLEGFGLRVQYRSRFAPILIHHITTMPLAPSVSQPSYMSGFPKRRSALFGLLILRK